MLVGDWAIALNFASSVLWPFAEKRLREISAQMHKVLLWTWAGFPAAVAVTAMMLLTPGDGGVLPTFCWDNAILWHHVDVFSVTSWHGVLLSLSSLPLIWVLSRHGFRHWSYREGLRSLTSLSTRAPRRQVGQASVVELDADQVGVFSTDTTCYMTRGLLKRLSAQDVDIVTRHELAHIDHQDGRHRAVFSLLSAFYPSLVSRRLRASYCLATEQIADQAAVKHHSAVDVAAALVRVARLQQGLAGPSRGSVSFFAREQVSLRVEHLLDPARPSALPIRYACLPVAALVVLLSLGMVDGFHHLAEVFFSH